MILGVMSGNLMEFCFVSNRGRRKYSENTLFLKITCRKIIVSRQLVENNFRSITKQRIFFLNIFTPKKPYSLFQWIVPQSTNITKPGINVTLKTTRKLKKTQVCEQVPWKLSCKGKQCLCKTLIMFPRPIQSHCSIRRSALFLFNRRGEQLVLH